MFTVRRQYSAPQRQSWSSSPRFQVLGASRRASSHWFSRAKRLIDRYQPPQIPNMRGPNPELIQPEDWSQPDRQAFNTPVFLIHDGGGTTFAYHCLEVLERHTYGIHHPYFYTGEVFEGGIPEMGRVYADWIRETVLEDEFPDKRRNPDGTVSVMLGGWSLGGLLSLEVARRLATDSVVRVTGILMIDSIYPGRSIKSAHSPLVHTSGPPKRFPSIEVPKFTIRGLRSEDDASSEEDSSDEASVEEVEEELTDNQINSRRCMAEAMRMVRQWRLPEWDGELYNRKPRVVLLRAKEYVPTADGRLVGMDLNREDELLGWGDYDEEMFCDVLDVDGHHFDMFAFDRLDDITRSIKKGLDRLEEQSQMMMF